MQELFPGDTVYICERPEDEDRENPNQYYVDMQATEYFGSLHSNDLPPYRERPRGFKAPIWRPFCGFTPALLRVNKSTHAMAQKHLYSKKFSFKQCSAVGADTFLHKHRRYGHHMTQLDLYYEFRPRRPEIDTYGADWHRMMCELRHHFYVPCIQAHVRSRFWAIAKWEQGPRAVLEQEAFKVGMRDRPNFLEDVAKIAAPADRFSPKRGYCGDGTDVQIFIVDTESDEQVEFVRRLNEEISLLRLARVLFTPRVMDYARGTGSDEYYTRPFGSRNRRNRP
jgi:hypothetical protein